MKWAESHAPLPLGNQTNFGEIVAIKFIEGERYYFCIDGGKTVSFLPAEVLESAPLKVSNVGDKNENVAE